MYLQTRHKFDENKYKQIYFETQISINFEEHPKSNGAKIQHVRLGKLFARKKSFYWSK